MKLKPPYASIISFHPIAVHTQPYIVAGNVKVAQAEFESAKTQLTASQAQVQQFAAARHSAQIDFDYTYIKAPVDGIVVARRVDVGQTVAASLSAPTLFEIAQDLTKMQVDTNVSEADVGHVQVGQQAPDFTLTTVDLTKKVTLSSFKGSQPVVLVFGSYT